MNGNKYIKELYDDPEIYIKEFSNYKDDIYFWPKLIDQYKPRTVLEVGIGNGRLVKLLHNKVKEYDGVDFSKSIIDYCANKYNYKNVNYYCSNIKEFKVDKKYDLIILPFNVFNNFYEEKDIRECMDSLKKLSNENTIIVIDTFNPTNNDLCDTEDYIKTNSFKIDNKTIDVYEKRLFNITYSTNIYKKRYICNGKVIKEYILPNRVFLHQELKLIINSYGFEIIKIYGDYNFEDYKNTSRKQICVIRRKSNEVI